MFNNRFTLNGPPTFHVSPGPFSPVRSESPNRSRLVHPSSAPTGRPQQTKVRGDGKKCRKIHGINRRELWCNACRWKKACVAFPD